MSNTLTAFINRSPGPDSSPYWFELWIADGFVSIRLDDLKGVCSNDETYQAIINMPEGKSLEVKLHIFAALPSSYDTSRL